MRKLLFFFLLSCISIESQVFDTNYGTNGRLYVDIPPNANKEYNNKTFYTSDQKTVNVGYYDTGSFTTKTYFVTKYNFDGTPDANFGNNGLLSIPNLPNNTGQIMINGSVMLDDNSIILSCSANMKAYLIKITSNGTIDTSFGINGFKLADFLFTANTMAYGNLIKDENNQIFVVYNSATYITNGFKAYINLCKIFPDGTIDTNFGNNGFSSVLINRDYNYVDLKKTRIKNGKVYNFATLSYYDQSGNSQQTDVWICHYLNGTPDSGFGDNGYIYTPKDIYIYDYNIQDDGKILIAKYVDVSAANKYLRAARYLRSGAIDTSFGNAGVVESGFGQWSTHIPYKIMEMDHNIYIFSIYRKSDSPIDYTSNILKYNASGIPDLTFGTNGMFKFPANIHSITDVFVNGNKGFIISAQNVAFAELVNMKVNYETGTLNTDNVSSATPIKPFPNPVADILYVSGFKNEKFTIFNSLGQKMKTGFYTDKGIHVQDLNKGNYWLKLENSQAVQFIKK